MVCRPAPQASQGISLTLRPSITWNVVNPVFHNEQVIKPTQEELPLHRRPGLTRCLHPGTKILPANRQFPSSSSAMRACSSLISSHSLSNLRSIPLSIRSIKSRGGSPAKLTPDSFWMMSYRTPLASNTSQRATSEAATLSWSTVLNLHWNSGSPRSTRCTISATLRSGRTARASLTTKAELRCDLTISSMVFINHDEAWRDLACGSSFFIMNR